MAVAARLPRASGKPTHVSRYMRALVLEKSDGVFVGRHHQAAHGVKLLHFLTIVGRNPVGSLRVLRTLAGANDENLSSQTLRRIKLIKSGVINKSWNSTLRKPRFP